jgi:hypothetical protein
MRKKRGSMFSAGGNSPPGSNVARSFDSGKLRSVGAQNGQLANMVRKLGGTKNRWLRNESAESSGQELKRNPWPRLRESEQSGPSRETPCPLMR